MLPSLIAMLVWLPALVGLGSLVPSGVPEEIRPGVAGLLGLCLAAAVSVALNVVAPVSAPFPALLWLTGVAVLLLRGRDLLRARWRREPHFLLALLVCVAALSQLPGRNHDAGLYYLQAVEWAQSGSQPLGLANLQPQLGFNSAWFSMAAAMELPGLRGHSGNFVNGLLVVLGIWAAAGAVARIRGGDRAPGVAFFAAMTITSTVAIESLGYLGTDVVVTVLASACMALWVDDDGRSSTRAVGVALVLSAMAVAVKSSAGLLFGAGLAIAVVRAIRTRDRTLLVEIGVVLGFMAAWAARGVMASGCLLYPLPATCIAAVPWAVPAEDAAHIVRVIASWARNPDLPPNQVLGNWDWLAPWSWRAAQTLIYWVLLVAFLIGLAACLARRPVRIRRAAIPIGVGLAGTALWLLSAPDLRFGLGYFAPLMLTPGALAIARCDQRIRLPRYIVVAFATCIAASAVWGARHARKLDVETFHIKGFARVPATLARPVTNAAGFTAYVPPRGNHCWQAPLPCTHKLDPALDYRGMFLIDRDLRRALRAQEQERSRAHQ